MSAVRVGEVAGDEDQLRSVLLEQLESDADVFRTDRILVHFSGLIERKIEKARLLALHSETSRCRDGLRFADRALHHLHWERIDLPLLLEARSSSTALISAPHRCVVEIEVGPKRRKEIGVAAHLVIEDGDVARRLIRDDNLVLVLVQLVEHAAH